MPTSIAIALVFIAIAVALATELYFKADDVVDQYFQLGLRLRFRTRRIEVAIVVAGIVAATMLHIFAGMLRLVTLAGGLACLVVDRSVTWVSIAAATIERKALPE